MRRPAAALAVLLILPAALPAADPPPTIDQLVKQLADLRSQKAELEKRERAALADLRERLKVLNDLLKDLDVGPVVPPNPPKPADPLAAALRAAYAADAGPEKAQQLADLAELYRQAAELAADPACLTAAELVERVRAAAKVLKIDGLAQVRRLVAAEVAAVFPEDAALTAESRAAARALFLRVHAALRGAGG